jgi:hypothetical protein
MCLPAGIVRWQEGLEEQELMMQVRARFCGVSYAAVLSWKLLQTMMKP